MLSALRSNICRSFNHHITRPLFTTHTNITFTTRNFSEAAAEKQVDPKDASAIKSFLSKLNLVDHSEKFSSFSDLLHTNTRQLKAHGLNITQRKTLLKMIDRYKTQQRFKKAEEYIYAHAHSQTPSELQQNVMKIVYAHVYARVEQANQNEKLEAEWRALTDEYNAEKFSVHNQLRGTLNGEYLTARKLDGLLVKQLLEQEKRDEAEALENQKEIESLTQTKQQELQAARDAVFKEYARRKYLGLSTSDLRLPTGDDADTQAALEFIHAENKETFEFNAEQNREMMDMFKADDSLEQNGAEELGEGDKADDTVDASAEVVDAASSAAAEADQDKKE